MEVEDGEAAVEEVVGHLTVPNLKLKLKIKINQSIREPNILICLLVLGLGVVCIIRLGCGQCHWSRFWGTRRVSGKGGFYYINHHNLLDIE